jgi:uncharacterized protein DUF4365
MRRPFQHVMEDQAGQLIRRLLPDEWIIREVRMDYGVDLEIEIVDEDVVTGNRIWVQSKASKRLDTRSREFSIGNTGEDCDDTNESTESHEARYFAYRITTKELSYALQCTIPLLLFVCDLERGDIFWLPLRDEAIHNTMFSRPGWRAQQTVSVHIPEWNSIRRESSNGFPGLRWYALEPARMTAFAMLHYYHHEYQYGSPLSGYVVGDGFIEYGEESVLRSSLKLAKIYLESALEIDVLFGRQGIDSLIPVAERLRQGQAAAQELLGRLDDRNYDYQSVGLLNGIVSHAMDLLSTTIASYQGFRQNFLLTRVAAL